MDCFYLFLIEEIFNHELLQHFDQGMYIAIHVLYINDLKRFEVQ